MAAKDMRSGKTLREPPYSVSYEQAVLAACIIEGGQDSLPKCIDMKLTPSSFYIPAHAEIFKACLALYKAGSPVQFRHVVEQLRVTGKLERVGGEAYLNQVTDCIETTAHLSFDAKKVKELEIARNLVRFFTTGLEDAYRGIKDIDQFLETTESRVLEINQGRVEDSAVAFNVPLDKAAINIQKLSSSQGKLSGISSGFCDLDNKTNGFHPGEMIVLAARPSMGKTALALNIAETVILGENPVPTLFFSLEMSAEQLAMRMIFSHGRLDISKLRSGFGGNSVGGKNEEKEFNQKSIEIIKELKPAPFWIDESSNLTILELRAKARRVHNQHPLGLIIIDYLQLLSGTDPRVSREQQIAEISRGVKGLAKELNVPVLVLSQLNRESEKERRQPRLSDLRESGSIEQDADLVLLLSKRASEDGAEEMSAGEGFEEGNTVVRDLIIAKQRNGPVGVVPLTYQKPYTRFENYTREREVSL